MKRICLPCLLGLLTLIAAPAAYAQATDIETVRERAPEDEVIYFVLPDRFANGDPENDRGGIDGDAPQHGFDPAHKGFYHGGDLAGLTSKLDYIEQLGVTAIWFAPIFQNKPVQGPEGNQSAGYHGYWVTDFTSIDPHFGTNAEFKAFVDAAHARGMKVYMDIITNHTADVIQYADRDYSYRSLADYPYSTRGGVEGESINEGFLGDEIQTEENFARLTSPDFAYTPVVPDAERSVKVPGWLNDPIYYHNRGSTTFSGESSRYGDFAGLDDLFTEHPRVLEGMKEIYAGWITRFGIDGFRIDTAKHVNPEFWQSFVPAMLKTAEAEGIPNFHIFGEVYAEGPNSGTLAQFTRRDGFPTVLDFAFQSAMRESISRGAPPSIIVDMFAGDVNYAGGEQAAMALPTFLGNHDMGRFSTIIKSDNPEISQDELLDRVMLGHAMMMVLRGTPVIYYGDEQGFVGDGHDQAAREDMFPSVTASYNDNDLIGTDATTADANFDSSHPLFVLIRDLAALRADHTALRRGRQVARAYRDDKPGLLSFSRFDPDDSAEYLLAFNTSLDALSELTQVGYSAIRTRVLHGQCTASREAVGSVRVSIEPLGWCFFQLSEDEE